MNGKHITLQIDTASDVTMISMENWKNVGKPTLHAIDINPGSASGDVVELKGFFKCTTELNGVKAEGKIYVSINLNLLGIDWITKFDLWNVPLSSVCNNILLTDTLTMKVKSKFPKLFSDGLGRCTKMKAALKLKPGASPVYRKARSVPFAAAPVIANEYTRLIHLTVFEPTEYSDNAAPVVVMKKANGTLRVCGDYSTGLNDVLEPNSFPIPTPETIFAKMVGMKVFSVIDLTEAFLQVELDEESSKLCTLNTHIGLLKVNRLQPGLKPAPGIFQELMSKMLSGTRSSYAFMDEILVAGKDKIDHQRELFDVLDRIQDYGFRLRHEKCDIEKDEVKFVGHIISGGQVKPNPKLIQQAMDFMPPKNVKEVQSFLGLVNYYNKFIRNMSDLRAPLDELTKKDVKFEWKPKHQKAFEELKKVLNSDLVLTHYDPNKKLVVAADASSYAIGASLMHEFADGSLHPIMFASTTLNSAEKNYSQIERESLALVFGVKKFHYFIYGRKFELQTDHKPLLAIFGSKSGIPAYTASRLQRYAITLLAYNFSITYVNTESFGYVDALSRLMRKHQQPDDDVVIAAIRADEPESDMHCFAVETALKLPIKFEHIQKATAECPTLQTVIKLINEGWPESAKKLENAEVEKFFLVRNQLIVIENCIFYGDRIVVPHKFRRGVLDELHTGHPGMSRMKLLAR